MDNNLVNTLTPLLAIVISIFTWTMTSRHTNEVDNRSAAKQTVEILNTQNQALLNDIKDLRERLVTLERAHGECQNTLASMREKIAGLQSTLEPPA